jgi:hypothetical protein
MKTPIHVGGHSLKRLDNHVSTVSEEHLQGSEDRIIALPCKDKGLCLITVDLGFAQILEYPPNDYPGIIVLRHPAPTLSGMHQLVSQVAVAIETRSPDGRLWIVEPGRIRVHGIPQDKDE